VNAVRRDPDGQRQGQENCAEATDAVPYHGRKITIRPAKRQGALSPVPASRLNLSLAKPSFDCYFLIMNADIIHRFGAFLIAAALALWPAALSAEGEHSSARAAVVLFQAAFAKAMPASQSCRRCGVGPCSVANGTCLVHCTIGGAILPAITVDTRIIPAGVGAPVALPADGFLRPPDPYPPRPIVIG